MRDPVLGIDDEGGDGQAIDDVPSLASLFGCRVRPFAFGDVDQGLDGADGLAVVVMQMARRRSGSSVRRRQGREAVLDFVDSVDGGRLRKRPS